MDARSVFDFLGTDSGKLPSDRRLALDLRLVQHYLRASQWKLKWIAGPQQLADVLTKENGDIRYLSWVLKNARFQLLRDEKLEDKVSNALSEAEKRLREEESPEERQRRRNKQKSENHKRREEVVNRLVGSTVPSKRHKSNWARATQRRSVRAAMTSGNTAYDTSVGLKHLRHASV